MRRIVAALTVSLAVLAATLLPSLAPAGAAVPHWTPAPAWAPCPEDPGAACARLTLPVDWDDPRGPAFQMAVARRPATDPAARIGTLVINPGGPGGSGVDAVLRNDLRLSPRLLARFDLVGFDPRGVGRSNPVLCSRDLALRTPDPIMRTQADFQARLAFNARYSRDCRARTGPLYDHVDTLSVVRDVDALRAALGEDRLTYYGASYGTLIGQQYAERYPGRVRALAMDGNMDHDLDTTRMLDTDTWTTQDSFDEFVKWCAAARECELHGRDVRALFADLMARAERGELSLPQAPDGRLTPFLLVLQTFSATYGPDWAALAAFLRALDAGTDTARPLVTRPAGEETFNDATQVICQDYWLPVRDQRAFQRHLRRLAAIAPDMRFSPISISGTAACLGQPVPVPNPQHRLRVSGTPPLLLVNGLHDPATGYPWAQSTARQIGREARLLTYEGWGHVVYGRGACADRAVEDYLISLTVPAKGARCPAVPPGQGLAGRSAPPRPPSGPVPGLPGWVWNR
ncbi:alpha/beta hydrolase [Spongiactinospora sp. TRM90649]|uniref:alpha/beta hydrolase n=1 Tax=Spongiactinospora sp. TRM90649 TaxID=3031114 RepID=UPI0023FA3F52|nr:alpha/beta hydrolase [Spongiactinospora sp. TRM90649]MDF5758017.1 alpha/beta hydrolase [Spongiactinospora sp. TRM90649]